MFLAYTAVLTQNYWSQFFSGIFLLQKCVYWCLTSHPIAQFQNIPPYFSASGIFSPIDMKLPYVFGTSSPIDTKLLDIRKKGVYKDKI